MKLSQGALAVLIRLPKGPGCICARDLAEQLFDDKRHVFRGKINHFISELYQTGLLDRTQCTAWPQQTQTRYGIKPDRHTQVMLLLQQYDIPEHLDKNMV